MASSPLTSKSFHHARSISLPYRPHPLVLLFDEHLRSLSNSEATSSSIGKSLSGLENMYDGLDDLLLLPHAQQALAQKHHEKLMEEVLDGYVRLLDVCATAKDVSSQAKQDVQNLLSALRRRRNTNDFAGYIASRKKAKKMIRNALKDLKCIKSKHVLDFEKEHENLEIISYLNEVEAATFGVFESLLSHIAATKVQSRPVAFSLVSKLMNRKSISSKDEETNASDFEKFDAALDWLDGTKPSKTDNVIHIKNVQNQLGKMELSIQDLEGGLECLFRRLIKTRVSLLNILNH
ncbi:Peripherin like [Actinidia chinensis var. chinensis]|uniref:Peripherin like n=1 Tax=Actinidia chinensis var. chinensis TaxID=1590841 RepID=A0A2R6QQD1_ACTCC|nr:Peripherin like [Actinidia chinensis var. chinensis]